MTILRCDHCQVEANDPRGITVKEVRLKIGNQVADQDLCEKCLKKVVDRFYGSVGD